MIKKIIIALILLFVIIQFFTIDKTNPPVDLPKDFITVTNTPPEVSSMIKNSCYDCHSHETKYPWYSNVAPVSWLLKSHINDGRKHLNFSTWSDYNLKKKDHKLEDCIDMVKSEEMPMKPYLLMHSDAQLSVSQRKVLISFFTELKDSLIN